MINFNFNTDLEIDDVIDIIFSNLDDDQVTEFIAKLEERYGNWEVTEKLIKHFLYLKEIFISEFYERIEEDEYYFKPEKIKIGEAI